MRPSRLLLCLLPVGLLFAACGGSGDNPADGDHDPVDGDTDTPRPLVSFVNPFIGTGGVGFGAGSAFPGATVPFGMCKPGPDTQNEHGALPFYHFIGYYWDDDYIQGFSHFHLHGIGANDYGSILLMPNPGRFDERYTRIHGYMSRFEKGLEQASPGYYAVTMENGITAELTATVRCAVHRYTQAAAGPLTIVVDPSHHIPGVDVTDTVLVFDPTERSVSGSLVVHGGLSGRQGGIPMHFYARFDAAFDEHGAWDKGGQPAAVDRIEGGAVTGYVTVADTTELNVSVCVSLIDIGQAETNFEAELEGRVFDQVWQAAREAWETELARIEVGGGSDVQREIFHTAVYHSLLMPTIYTDADSRYLGFDRQVHQADGFVFHSDFSLWDTFRTQHPLLSVVWPERQLDMLRSFVEMCRQSGRLPRWAIGPGEANCMIGTHADTVIADSVARGLDDFDLAFAYECARRMADPPDPPGSGAARGGIEGYVEHGWVPHDSQDSSVSKTLEYAFEDQGLAFLAGRLGLEQDRQRFLARAQNYRTLWNAEAGFFVGRRADGGWIDLDRFDPLAWDDQYTEANAWQYLFFVPHDPAGLIGLMGGPETFASRLEQFFANGAEELANRTEIDKLMPQAWYFHSNEPDIHAAWMFIDAGRPDLAQKWVRWIIENRYSNLPDGIAGNDDCGTLSAWYVWAALGLYPVVGTSRFYLTGPLFPEATIRLPEGKTIRLIAEGHAAEPVFVREVHLDGEPVDGFVIDGARLTQGGEIRFVMGR